MKIKIILHVAYALERTVVNDELKCAIDKDPISTEIAASVDKTCEIFKRTLNILLPNDEKYYICKIVSSEEEN